MDLQAHVGKALADALVHQNTLQRAVVVARLVLAAAKLVEVGEVERRLDALEARLNGMERSQ